MRYLVNLAYDGSNFYGFQKQKDKRTVAGILESNLSKVCNEEIKVVGCSRTDRKVHAKDFYFHFDTSKDLNTFNAIKVLSKEDIYVKSIKKVNDDFHCRYLVKNKEYLYIINTKEYDPFNRNYELEYNKEINIELLNKAIKYFMGKKDFKSLTGNEKDNTIRTINYIKIKELKGKVYIYINGDGFLKYMVRNIVGLLLDLNEGKINLSDIQNILKSKDRNKAGRCASAEGLYLNKVNY